MKIVMKTTQEQKKIEPLITSFVERGLDEQSAKSLLLKLYLLHKHNYLDIKTSSDRELNLFQIIKKQNWFLTHLIKELEIFSVSIFPIPLSLLQEISRVFSGVSASLFFSYIKDIKSSKLEGQYFTPNDMINQVFSELDLLKETKKQTNINVLDCSAGLGDFLSILIHNNNILNYAVELNKLTYEYMLFNFLFDDTISESKRAKIILTLKQGDALKGYNTETINLLFKTDKGKDIVLEYKKVRENILKSDEILITDIKKVLTLRSRIVEIHSSFKKFNWFLDFPEIFFNRNLQLKTENVFDFVCGNPPWIKFGSFNIAEYKDVLSHSMFANQLQGKFNFSLPFIILGYRFTKNRGALVVPKGIVSETYASKWREKIFEERTISKIMLSSPSRFRNVVNEYGLIFWDKTKKSEYIQISDEKSGKKIDVDFKSIKHPLFRIPLIPRSISQNLNEVFEESQSQPLKNLCEIRRGLTLSRKYQKLYFGKSLNVFKKEKVKKIIRHNSFSSDKREGVGNFQVFYGGEQFVYDKKLLGAPGSASLFEQNKIIRRNRGKQWFVGLDLSKAYYVNDIFDIIYASDESKLFTIFGYLSSTLVQFLMENYIQRDITSNLVRELPCPHLDKEGLRNIETAVIQWINSAKNSSDLKKMRHLVDEIIFDFYNILAETKEYVQENTKLYWSN